MSYSEKGYDWGQPSDDEHNLQLIVQKKKMLAQIIDFLKPLISIWMKIQTLDFQGCKLSNSQESEEYEWPQDIGQTLC